MIKNVSNYDYFVYVRYVIKGVFMIKKQMIQINIDN